MCYEREVKVGVPKHEQEVGISFSRTDEDMVVSVSDKTWQTKLKRGGWRPVSTDGLYEVFVIPKRFLTVRKRPNSGDSRSRRKQGESRGEGGSD